MQLIQCSLLLSALYMFTGGFSAHHQELIKLYVQPWVLSRFPAIHTSSRQPESMTIPKAAHTVLYAPDDGRKNHPKTCTALEIIMNIV
jgi:hypothetical protein